MNAGQLPGREAELGVIAEAIARAAAGTPTAVLVEGEAGGGRTALLRHLEDSPLLPRRKIRVVLLDLAEGGDPVLLAAGRLTHHQAFARLGGRRRALAAFRKVLPDWISAIPGYGDLLEAITVTAAAIRRRGKKADPAKAKLPEEMEELHEAARRRAAALLIDGGEAIAPGAAERLFRLLDAAETGTRLLVIVTFRPTPPGSPPVPVVQALTRLPAERLARVALRPLDRAALTIWLEERLGGSVSPALIDDLLERTGGLPRAVDERVRTLQERDALRRVEEGWVAVSRDADSLTEPGPTADVVDLGPLGGDVREALAAASLLDEPFAALDVARSLERDELWVEDRLAAATRLGVLHVVDDAWEVDGDITSLHRFASTAVRAALRRGVEPQQRSVWSARTAAAGEA